MVSSSPSNTEANALAPLCVFFVDPLVFNVQSPSGQWPHDWSNIAAVALIMPAVTLRVSRRATLKEGRRLLTESTSV